MAHGAVHLRTDFVQSVLEHNPQSGQQLLSFTSELNEEATRQVHLACGQPAAKLYDALRWFAAKQKVTAVSGISVQLHPSGLLLTSTWS